MNPPKRIRQRIIGTSLLLISLIVTITNLSINPANANLTHYVVISDFAFHPQNLTIQMGDTIEWLNNDPVIHTLWFTRVKDQTTYTLSEPISPGESWSHTFNENTTLKYYDFDRLWITGFITVEPPPIPVGGVWVPLDKLALLGPHLALAVVVVAITIGAVYTRKRQTIEDITGNPTTKP